MVTIPALGLGRAEEVWGAKGPWRRTAGATPAWGSALATLACQSPAHTPCCRAQAGSLPTVPEALGADACVAIDRIHALGPVTAPVGHTVIVVHLAELPTVAGETVAPGTQQSETVPWAGPASRRPLLLPLSPRVPKLPPPPTLTGSAKPGPTISFTGQPQPLAPVGPCSCLAWGVLFSGATKGCRPEITVLGLDPPLPT